MSWKVSASAIGAFKACPMRFRLSYVERLRPAEDTEALRVGTNWHACLEVALAPAACDDARTPLERVVDFLNERYGTVPTGIDATAWAVEREVLANSVAGWLWYWQNDGMKTLDREIEFDLPIRNPANGRALPNARYIGKIDRIVEHEGQRKVGEYKSTSRPIDPESSYWDRLNLDTQVSVYTLAARQGIIQATGVLYDVWHRPTIRPKKLTQADTKKFIESGDYCGQKFQVIDRTGDWTVNGEYAEIEPGAKPGVFAIRETPQMFGARLLADIVERPEFYFARRDIARTDRDLEDFSWELLHLYQTMRQLERSGHWYRNESQCEATFRCPYMSICTHRQDVCDGVTTPEGFVRTNKAHVVGDAE